MAILVKSINRYGFIFYSSAFPLVSALKFITLSLSVYGWNDSGAIEIEFCNKF